ncbi:MAG: 2Fe-2S iron-sulfur cluster binding domain protein 3 [Parcubacteria group bacterium GW2011_GWA1_45_7]|nr:MAG: 2Fe-2S iron-sulfur cluster binding domain protein 3 [Parcubacteria group bacterium GW2011_GWA1_45_7]KKU11184.1 MAG: 2Fe-2S iron-sulfur cluster binding domain protein 3 [Parcubacteria group bacterium GW2011_GWF1_45_5]KKU47391.1 MAG: 2Fe-2S iron-sulfur cluster binding domain protein 3 [Parcubacteria group bacterium GW2011_GWF2_46_8]
MQALFSKSKVIENKKLNDKFHLVTLESSTPNFSFIPGQYVTMKIPPSLFRCYSIFSTPGFLPSWEIFVDIAPGGPGTTYIRNLKKGDIVETIKPTGFFTCQKDRHTNFIFAATGCGLAPYKSMIECLLDSPSNPNIVFLWGLRSEKDVVLRNIFDDWTKKYPNFRYEIVLSRPTKKWIGKQGHVNVFIVDETRKFPETETSVYLSGNSDFVEQNFAELKKIGFPKDSIHSESYC